RWRRSGPRPRFWAAPGRVRPRCGIRNRRARIAGCRHEGRTVIGVKGTKSENVEADPARVDVEPRSGRPKWVLAAGAFLAALVLYVKAFVGQPAQAAGAEPEAPLPD